MCVCGGGGGGGGGACEINMISNKHASFKKALESLYIKISTHCDRRRSETVVCDVLSWSTMYVINGGRLYKRFAKENWLTGHWI